MRKSRRPIIIASRRSPLARAQAEAVGAVLERLHPGVAVRYRWIESEGDRMIDTSLADAGGKGLFIKSLEQALLNEEADLAVHSLKDVPVVMTPGLVLAAVPRRGDVRDCLVTRDGSASLEQLPRGAVLGTSSPRRAAQVKRLRPDLGVQPLRGNVQTRIRKVIEEGQCDATLMAVAGLERSGLGDHARHGLDPSIVLPAAGQGALAIQCRMDDHVTLSRCLPLNDTVTGEAVHAERQIVGGLRGDCHSPIAVLAEPVGDAALEFRIRVRVLGPEGREVIELDERAAARSVRRLVKEMVSTLRTRGADRLLGEAAEAAVQRQSLAPRSPASSKSQPLQIR